MNGMLPAVSNNEDDEAWAGSFLCFFSGAFCFFADEFYFAPFSLRDFFFSFLYFLAACANECRKQKWNEEELVKRKWMWCLLLTHYALLNLSLSFSSFLGCLAGLGLLGLACWLCCAVRVCAQAMADEEQISNPLHPSNTAQPSSHTHRVFSSLHPSQCICIWDQHYCSTASLSDPSPLLPGLRAS